VRNFQILIVSSVKICKQCLQTALALGRRKSQTPARLLPLDPSGDGPHADHWATAPNWKFLALPLLTHIHISVYINFWSVVLSFCVDRQTHRLTQGHPTTKTLPLRQHGWRAGNKHKSGKLRLWWYATVW